MGPKTMQTVIYTKVCILMTTAMVKENKLTKMAKFMTESGIQVRNLAMVQWTSKMATHILECGKKISSMDKECSNGQTAIHIKECGNKEKDMAKEHTITLMVPTTRVAGLRTPRMVKGFSHT